MSHTMALRTQITLVALVYKAPYRVYLLPPMLFCEGDNETCIYDVEAVSRERHRESDMEVANSAKRLNLTYSLQVDQ